MKTSKKDVKITDDLIDEVIETVLKYMDSEHYEDRDEDGYRDWVEYFTMEGCEKAVREVLNDRSKKGR